MSSIKDESPDLSAAGLHSMDPAKTEAFLNAYLEGFTSYVSHEITELQEDMKIVLELVKNANTQPR